MNLAVRAWNWLTGRSLPAQLLAPTVANPVAQPLYRQTATFKLFDFLAGVPDPDEVLRRTGRSRADLRQLMRDAEVCQALDTRREAVLATPWSLEPYESVQEKWLYDELAPIIPQLVTALWQAVPYGYSVIETVYARKEGGRVGVGQLFNPPFEWFRPLPDGTLRYFPLDGSGGVSGIECDPRKFTYAARNSDYRNPYGDALLSALYWPVTWRLQGWQLWLDFLETFGAPIIVGQVTNYNEFVDAMMAQGVKRVVGYQPLGGADAKEGVQAITASTAGEFDRLEEALNKTIQKVVLGQTLTSDVGANGGALATAKVQNEVRDDKRRADLRIVVNAAQHVVDNLWALNGFAGDPPAFGMQDDTGLEKERADRDKVLVDVGVRFTEQYIVDHYDLESTDFTVTDPTPPPVIPGQQGKPGTPARAQQAATHARFTPEQQQVEDALDRVLALARQPITLAELRGAIRAARNADDLAERLAVLIDRQDPAYRELLARAQFAATVLGYVHAHETITPVEQ